MRRVAIVLVPLLAVAGLVSVAQPAAAQHPGANGAITYIDEAVWSGTPRADGTPRACCSLENADMQIVPEEAVWGPDGHTLAVIGTWVRDGGPGTLEILVYDLLTDEVRSLGAADRSRPDFSPDGTQVVVTRGGDLVVLDVASGAVSTTLTTTPGVAETDPSWSPDGTSIAYAGPTGVSVLPATGGAPTLIVPGGSAPQYSGDGTRLAYLAGGQLWIAAADGTGAQCTNLPVYGYSWSPDSTELVVHVDLTPLGDEWQSSDVWIVSPAGAQLRTGPGHAASTSFSWQPVPDPEPGVVTPTSSVSGAPSSFSRSTAILVRWTASDLVSPVVSTDVRYRRSDALGGGTTSPRTWIAASTDRRATLDAVPGHRYCFSSRARNAAGAVSTWSAEKCSVVPFDDRQLRAEGAWVRATNSGLLRGTVTRTTQRYAALTSAPGFVREVGILASTGPNAGRVAVLVGSRRVGAISLESATRHDRVLLVLPRLAERRYGAVRLVVLTGGRTVRIDGLAASAW